jgi:hypothetical protein
MPVTPKALKTHRESGKPDDLLREILEQQRKILAALEQLTKKLA